MTDHSDDYPFEWLDQQIHPMDPRLSDILEERQPDAVDRLVAAETLHAYASHSPAFAALLCTLTITWYEQLRWPTILLAILEQVTQHLIGAQGEELTVKRLAADFLAAREDVIKEAE